MMNPVKSLYDVLITSVQQRPGITKNDLIQNGGLKSDVLDQLTRRALDEEEVFVQHTDMDTRYYPFTLDTREELHNLLGQECLILHNGYVLVRGVLQYHNDSYIVGDYTLSLHGKPILIGYSCPIQINV